MTTRYEGRYTTGGGYPPSHVDEERHREEDTVPSGRRGEMPLPQSYEMRGAEDRGTIYNPYYIQLQGGDRPNPLSAYLHSFLDIATASLKEVINDSPTSFGTGLMGYYMVPGKVLAYAGMTASQLGTLALIASVVFKALEPVIDASTYREEVSKQWKLTVLVVNTAVVTACIATAFGVALPTAKGMILTAGLLAGVKYAMVYMQSEGSHGISFRSDERYRYQ